MVLVVYKRKPSQKNRANIFKLWHKHPSLKLVFLLLGILPAHQKGGPDVWGGARWGGWLEDSGYESHLPRELSGRSGWAGVEKDLEELPGERDRVVEQGGRCSPAQGSCEGQSGPRKTLLSVMWVSGGSKTPECTQDSLCSF